MRYVLAVVLDCLLLSAMVAVLFILLTGGGVYTIGHMRVSSRAPDNLLLSVAVWEAICICRRFPLSIWIRG